MREILFRGKKYKTSVFDKTDWVYGSLIDSGNHEQVTIYPWYNGASTMSVRQLVYARMEAVKPETVGQYTGIHDKNGKSIFEGDICRNTKTNEIVSVNWHGTMAGYVWSKRKENNKSLYDFGELFRAFDKYEVIGNIHDNPELLGGAK